MVPRIYWFRFLSQLDDQISGYLSNASTVPLQVIASIVLICVYLPYFLIAVAIVAVLYALGAVLLQIVFAGTFIFADYFSPHQDLLSCLDAPDARHYDDPQQSHLHPPLRHCPRHLFHLVPILSSSNFFHYLSSSSIFFFFLLLLSSNLFFQGVSDARSFQGAQLPGNRSRLGRAVHHRPHWYLLSPSSLSPRPSFIDVPLGRWLALRFSVASSFFVTVVAVLLVLFEIEPAIAGLLLSYSMTFYNVQYFGTLLHFLSLPLLLSSP